MRDPKRIPVLLDRLMLAWMKVPDMRLGQLMENCHRRLILTDTHEVGPDLFNIEDEALIAEVEALVEQVTKS